MEKTRFLSRTDFALLASVSPAAVYAAVKRGVLAPAMVGKRLDVNHPAAKKYLNQSRPQKLTGPDPLYDQAVEASIDRGKFVVTHIAKQLGIGPDRARTLLARMRAEGVSLPPPPLKRRKRESRPLPKEPPKPAPPPPEPRIPVGREAAKIKRKSAPPPEAQDDDADGYEIPEHIQDFADMTLREIIKKFGTDTRFVDFLSAIQKIEIISEKRIKNASASGDLVSRSLVKKGVIEVYNAAHIRIMKDGAKTITATALAKHKAGISGPEIEAHVSDLLGSFLKPVKNRISRALRRD